MYDMTLRHTLIFFIVAFLYYGVWQFIWLRSTRKYYTQLKKEGESYFDFLCRFCTSPVWGIKRRLGYAKLYRLKTFGFFVKLKGIIFIVLGLAILIAMLLLQRTGYRVYLDMQL